VVNPEPTFTKCVWPRSCIARRMSPPRTGIYNARHQKQFRKQLRNSLTSAEAILWRSLKDRALLGKKFRRQTGIGRYIVDFYCPECGLVIELDGARHYSITIERYEAERTRYLESRGIRIIRFENKEVYEDVEAVLEKIKAALVEST